MHVDGADRGGTPGGPVRGAKQRVLVTGRAAEPSFLATARTSELRVLLAYAYHDGPRGGFPGPTTLRRMTGLTSARIREARATLIRAGILARCEPPQRGYTQNWEDGCSGTE